MSTYQITKNGRQWQVTDADQPNAPALDFKTKAAAAEFVQQLENQPRVVKAEGKGWDLLVAGTVVATFPRKSDAERERRAALADAAAAEAEMAEEPAVDVKQLDRAQRLSLAKAETAAVKAWEDGGRQGDRPATPALDLMKSGGKAPKAKKAGSAAKGGASRLRVAEEDRPAVLAQIIEYRQQGMSWAKIGVAFQSLPFRTTTGEPIPESNLYLIAKFAPQGDARNPEVQS